MVASELAAKGQGIITCSTSKLANMAILFLADSVISVVDLQNTYNHKYTIYIWTAGLNKALGRVMRSSAWIIL